MTLLYTRGTIRDGLPVSLSLICDQEMKCKFTEEIQIPFRQILWWFYQQIEQVNSTREKGKTEYIRNKESSIRGFSYIVFWLVNNLTSISFAKLLLHPSVVLNRSATEYILSSFCSFSLSDFCSGWSQWLLQSIATTIGITFGEPASRLLSVSGLLRWTCI